MKNKLELLKSRSARLAAGSVALVGSAQSWALDTTAVQTAITAAETDGLSVGAMVVAAVAAMVVVGVVIGMVRKI
jgi:heme/copper-type cytochrome/quinol oxidase subunit 2